MGWKGSRAPGRCSLESAPAPQGGPDRLQGLERRAGVVVQKDPLGVPAAPAQIDRASLGESGAMAEAAALDAPETRSGRRQGEKGAGQVPQGAADGIAPQHHAAGGTRDLQGHHPAARPRWSTCSA